MMNKSLTVGDRVYFIENTSILSRKYPLGVISRLSYEDEDVQLCTIQWDNGVVAIHQQFEIDSVENALKMLSLPISKD